MSTDLIMINPVSANMDAPHRESRGDYLRRKTKLKAIFALLHRCLV